MSTSNIWIIVDRPYEDGTTKLYYTLENDETDYYYEVNSNNTLPIDSIMTEIDRIIGGDTVVLDMTNIDSYTRASTCIRDIGKQLNVVLFMGDGYYGDEFSLTGNANLLTFSIRQKKDTETNANSGTFDLRGDDSLKIIDINRFKLVELIISGCPNCESIIITNAGSANIYIGGENNGEENNGGEKNGEFVLDDFTSLTDLTIIGYTAKTISLSSSTTNETFKSLNLTGSTCESINLSFDTFKNITGIILTNCDKIDKFNDGKQYEFIAEGIESLETVNLTGTLFTIIKVARSSNIKNIFIPLPVTYVDIYDLSYISNFNMSDYKKLEYLEISNTGITTLEGVYEPDENINMEIYATHEAFKSLTLKNRKIKAMGFSTIGFSKLICTSCSFKDNTLDLSNYTKLTNIGLNNCGLTAFTPNSTVVYLNISSNSLTGFTINGEPTTDITSLTSLASLNISNTGFTELYGDGSNGQLLSSVDATGTVDITLTNYSNLSSLEFSTIGNLNISGCSSINETFTISSINENTSINIDGTSIKSLEISNSEETQRSISSLVLSESTSELTLTNVNYQNQSSEPIIDIPNSLKTLNLNNCGIQTVSSENTHSNEFSLYANGGNFKNFDITNFNTILNLQVGGIKVFNFIYGDGTTTGVGGEKWNNTEVFDIAVDEFSGLQIDLSENIQKISRFNVTSGNLTNLSIGGWNPHPSPNQILNPDPKKSYINFSMENLQSLSLINSKITSLSLPDTNNLVELFLYGTLITSLEYIGTLENPKALRNISLPDTLTSLNLAYCTDLQDTIDPSEMKSLETFKIPKCNQKSNMEFKSESLSEVDLSLNAITSVKLSGNITSLNLEDTLISDDFIGSSDPSYYGTNASSLTTLKLANSNIGKISIPYNEGVMGKITTLSLPSNCSYLNISSQNKIQDLSTILGSCKKLNTLIANNCGLSGELKITSPLSTISLNNNKDLSAFDLSNYNDLSSFDLYDTKITNININSYNTITKAVMPTSTVNITFTKAIFTKSLQEFTFNSGNSPNLESLELLTTNITKLTCSYCPELNSVILARSNTQTREITGNNSLTSLTIKNCIALGTLKAYDCAALESVSISQYSNLNSVYLNNCPVLTSLTISKSSELSESLTSQTLDLVNCNIFDGTTLFNSNLGSVLPYLETLRLENTRIQILTIQDVSSFVNLRGTLKGFDKDGNPIGLTHLDLTRCSKFTGITDDNGNSLSFSSSTPYLENLNISGTAVLNIDCNGIETLESLSLPSSSVTVNVSDCSNLTQLDISGCENLAQLNAHYSAIENISTWDSEETKQTALTNIDMSSTGVSSINLANYTSLQTIDISNCSNLSSYTSFPSTLQKLKLNDTGISELEIPDRENLSELKLDNLTLSTFSIDGCKNLKNDYLQDLKITDSATFKNSGSTVPQGISTITPSSLTITETDWNSFSLNGALLNNSGNSITIKLNNNLESLSFDSKPDSPTYKNLDISYNIKLESINKTTNILDICRLLNANLIKYKDTDKYNELNINLVMNAFTADDKTELPQYLGIWPQITNRYQTGDTLLGEINFTAAAKGKEVTGEFIGLHENTKVGVDNLLQYSFNNITVWDVGKYSTSKDISTLSFGPILSLYVADVDGDVPDGPINISVNGKDMELFDIIGTMFDNSKKPEIIYTNSKKLKTLAEDKGIPVQILHTSTENWNPGYPYPNIFKIYFIMDNL